MIAVLSCLDLTLSSLSLGLRILLHTLLNPLSALLGMFFHLLWIGEQLFHLVRIRNVGALLYRRSAPHTLLPRLQSREVVDVDTRPAGSSYPAPLEITSVHDKSF